MGGCVVGIFDSAHTQDYLYANLSPSQLQKGTVGIMISPAVFMGLRGAHKILLSKKKKPDYLKNFPGINKIIEQIVANLRAHSAQWAKVNYKLTETEQKTKRHNQALWLLKAKQRNQTDISNFCYKM